jgi:hypothetical protein
MQKNVKSPLRTFSLFFERVPEGLIIAVLLSGKKGALRADHFPAFLIKAGNIVDDRIPYLVCVKTSISMCNDVSQTDYIPPGYVVMGCGKFGCYMAREFSYLQQAHTNGIEVCPVLRKHRAVIAETALGVGNILKVLNDMPDNIFVFIHR